GESSPIPGFHPGVLRTREGREVSGFGGHELAFYPVAHRFRWEAGDPEARRPLRSYQEGARGHIQILGVLPNGIWVVITARGLASRDLLRAFEAHRRRVARSLRAADGRPYGPFAALLRLAAGQPYRKGSSVVTPFMAVIGELERAPTEIGRAVRARWSEVQAWKMAWAGDGDGDDNGNGREEISSLSEAPAPRTEISEPVPAPAPAPAPAQGPEEVPAEEPEPAPSGPGSSP
ncbi:MAG: hypothetical protein NZ572_08175, partial [Thermoflexus sp.]|nr:hypothetical protein [Thermoflexus sp.]